MSSFELIASTKMNGKIPVTKYRSKRTGLTVVLGEVDGPVVNGFFSLGKYMYLHMYLDINN